FTTSIVSVYFQNCISGALFDTQDSLSFGQQPCLTCSAWYNFFNNNILNITAGYSFCNRDEFFCRFIKSVYFVIVSFYPQITFFVFNNISDLIIPETGPVARAGFVCYKITSVEPVNAIPCPKPHEPFTVTGHAEYSIMR